MGEAGLLAAVAVLPELLILVIENQFLLVTVAQEFTQVELAHLLQEQVPNTVVAVVEAAILVLVQMEPLLM
jgi:hypothetical protein